MVYKFEITNIEFHLIRDYVYSEYGIYIKDDRVAFINMKLYPLLLSLGME
jgi:hypothetical protein